MIETNIHSWSLFLHRDCVLICRGDRAHRYTGRYYRYLLVAIDVVSRKAVAQPLIIKVGNRIKDALINMSQKKSETNMHTIRP